MQRSEAVCKTITIELDREDLLDRLNEGRPAEDCIPDDAEILINDIPFVDGDDPIIVRYHETYDT